jgi:hypothetical protein
MVAEGGGALQHTENAKLDKAGICVRIKEVKEVRSE